MSEAQVLFQVRLWTSAGSRLVSVCHDPAQGTADEDQYFAISADSANSFNIIDLAEFQVIAEERYPSLHNKVLRAFREDIERDIERISEVARRSDPTTYPTKAGRFVTKLLAASLVLLSDGD